MALPGWFAVGEREVTDGGGGEHRLAAALRGRKRNRIEWPELERRSACTREKLGELALMIGKALEALNCADTQSARQRFLSFCHCQNWVERMADARPFASEGELFSMADECWAECNEPDYLEAFKAHPRIGDRKALAEKLAARVQQEQGQVSAAPESVIDALAEGNDTYFDRFGFIFIICATGKSAEHMLDQLRQRLGNDSDTELCIAAEQQRQIMRLRMQQFLEGSDG